MKKSIKNFIYKYSTVEEILDNYIAYLNKSDDIDSIQHATKLSEYKNIRLNEDLINHLKEIVFSIHSFLAKTYPNLQCEIQFRIKSLRHAEEKITRNILLGQSIDIKDFLGIRVIFFNENNLEDILKCYEIVVNVTKHIISNSCLLCQAESLVDAESFDSLLYPNIVVLTKDNIEESIPDFSKYSFGFKDYILTPKNSGYQSLHGVFKTVTGNFFEVQFRNLRMHQLAETSEFSHEIYKRDKYKDIALNIDPFRIHTQHYHIDKSGKYSDYDGIIEPLQLLVLTT